MKISKRKIRKYVKSIRLAKRLNKWAIKGIVYYVCPITCSVYWDSETYTGPYYNI